MEPQTEASVSSIVHDVVDNDIEQAQDEAETAQEQTQEVAAAVVEHVVIDAAEHESLRIQLASANAQIVDLEARVAQWQETQTAPEPEPELEQSSIAEPIEVEIAAPPTEVVTKQKRYLFNHPLKR